MSAIRCLGAALTLAATLGAQQPVPGPVAGHRARAGPLVHYGKWAAAVAAVTFTALGAHEHSSSTRAFNQLLDLCRADNDQCVLKRDGTYLNAGPEQLYQTSVHFDSRARLRLLVGQASLLFGAGMFLADLRHRENGPDNIPYHPLQIIVEARADGTRLGLRWMW